MTHQQGPVRIKPELESMASDLASNTLEQLWQVGRFPVDPYKIANDKGIEVYTSQIPGNVSGLLIKDRGEPAKIYVDIDDGHLRRRFTVAHELGHVVAHEYVLAAEGKETKDAAFSRVERRGGLASLGVDPDEIFANKFAAALLVPAQQVALLTSIPGISLAALASYFDVSPITMEHRLSNLGLLLR